MPSKLKSQEEISQISKTLKQKGKTIVTTNGSFDILHPAHVNLLEKAKNEGDILIVLLNSDESVKRLKDKNRPIQNDKDRAIMLSALESVGYVTIFQEDTPLNLLEKIKPNVHVKGGSFLQERIEQEQSILKKWNGKFKSFLLEEGYSTTSIIEKIIKINPNQ